jgi:hypothetical protein
MSVIFHRVEMERVEDDLKGAMKQLERMEKQLEQSEERRKLLEDALKNATEQQPDSPIPTLILSEDENEDENEDEKDKDDEDKNAIWKRIRVIVFPELAAAPLEDDLDFSTPPLKRTRRITASLPKEEWISSKR